MKQHIDRWRKFKDKALSRKRQVLSRGPRDNRSRVNRQELLLFALVTFLEKVIIPAHGSAPEADLLTMAIHDWKESLND